MWDHFSIYATLGLVMLCCRGKESVQGFGPTIFSPLIKKKEDISFSAKEDALTNLPVIGKGGCGEVYKEELPNINGKIIAIKKVLEPPKHAAELTEVDSKAQNEKMRQIRSEIRTVGRIRHRNLLPLLAHVPLADCHLLVYEYMKNGSLQDIIVKVSRGNAELDWPSRYKIALGIASALEYLHVNTNPRIIHLDLKPANILLDDDMEPRISDFGLAKEIPMDISHVSISNVAGTFGYIDPEYWYTYAVTEKCDVYSLGVILGVLVTGKLPNNRFLVETSGLPFVDWLRNVMTSNESKRAIFPKLIGNGYEEQMLLVLKIACFCTVNDPKERPNSKDVWSVLSQITH